MDGARKTPLPARFLEIPLAHRGLHDLSRSKAENSLRSADAAIEAGYGIELDVQLSSDGVAMVFHDYDLTRLTGRSGLVRERPAAELSELELLRGAGDRIPNLAEFAEFVGGRVPLLIELKDQSGCFGSEPDHLAASVVEALEDYRGPVALMSFNPHSVAHLARLAPHFPRGLTTMRFKPGRRVTVANARALSQFKMFSEVGASFISHDRRSLSMRSVAALHSKGVPILTWTVTSARQEAEARKIAQNITFEGYRPKSTASTA